METLARYLAECIDHEVCKICGCKEGNLRDINIIHKVIQEGIEAYESTERCKVTVESNQSEDFLQRNAFCSGFGYGAQYGYTQQMPLPDYNGSGSALLAMALFDRIVETRKKEIDSKE